MCLSKTIATSVVLFLIFTASLAQDREAHHGLQLLKEAHLFYENSAFDSALMALDEAARLFIENQDWGHYYECQFFTGQIWNVRGNTTQAQSIFESNLDGALTRLPENHPQLGEAYYQLGVIYSRLEQFAEAKSSFEQSLAIFKALHGEADEKVARSYGGMGYIHKVSNQYEQAVDFYQKAIAIFEQIQQDSSSAALEVYNNLAVVHSFMGHYEAALALNKKCLDITLKKFGEQNHRLSTFYYNIGNNYNKRGDFARALLYFEKVLALDEQLLGPHHPFVAEDYITIGQVHDQAEAFEQGYAYLQKGLAVTHKAYGPGHLKTAEAYFNMGEHFMLIHAYDSALGYYEKTIRMIASSTAAKDIVAADAFNSMGNILLQQQKPQEALQYFQQAENMLAETVGTDNPKAAGIYNNIAQLYLHLEAYDEAALYAQKALMALNPQFEDEDIYSNPTPEEVVLQPLLFDVLLSKIQAFRLRYEALHEQEALQYALENVQLTTGLIHQARQTYTAEKSKTGLTAHYYAVYEEGIGIAHELYKTGGHAQYLEQAFAFAEGSKSTLLYETLRASEARHFSAVPDSVLEQEQTLRRNFAFYQAQSKNQVQQSAATLQYFKAKSFEVKQAYDSLITYLEQHYPAYFDLKYNQELITIRQLQTQVLMPDHLVIEYFFGEKNIYIFAISQQEVVLLETSADDDFFQNVQLVRNTIASNTAPVSDFSDAAYAVYQKILAPLHAMRKDKSLIIIPDGILSYLSFEVLPTHPVQASISSYSQIPYLLLDQPIHYEYSATLWSKGAQRQDPVADFLAFAPEFNTKYVASRQQETADLNATGRGDLAALEGTSREIIAMADLFDGEFFQGNRASEKSFKMHASDYGIIHLATHAIIDDAHPMHSHLLFTVNEDTTEDGNLYAWELYNMQLNAQMAVLSACNTGFGKLQRGEGVMSLGRAFAYAGCPSIVMSLWPAQDQATADIMVNFYRALSEGMPKDQALRKAKLEYLAHADELFVHPFYWAGFVAQGNPDPLHLENSLLTPWLLGSLLALLALFVLFYFIRLKKH